MRRFFALAAVALVSAGCYHATVVTGQPAGTQTISEPWAHSFIAGLIPPSTVETAAECPNGVARVETQHTILNLLAQFVTFSLYSPMTIEVTCAAAEDQQEDMDVVDSRDELVDALKSGEAFYLEVPAP